MNTFLTPIERPKGLMKKLAYYFTRKQFGKDESKLAPAMELIRMSHDHFTDEQR